MPAYTTGTAFSQLDKCEFKCEGGHLKNNTAFKYLAEHLAGYGSPKFLPGQKVWKEIQLSNTDMGLTESRYVELHIVGMYADSGSENRFWCYDLAAQMPEPYFSSKKLFSKIRENAIFAEKPK